MSFCAGVMPPMGGHCCKSRRDATGLGDGPIGPRVITFVGERGTGRDVGTEIQQQFEERAVAGLAAGQVKADRLAVEVALELDLGGEAPARAAKGLSVLPPLMDGPPLPPAPV